jgi:hypothetical protein
VSYEVVLTDGAKRQLDEACSWYVGNAPHVADEWYDGFIAALAGLAENPERFGLAREDGVFPIEIRQLQYGSGKRKTHRAVFSIHGNRVVIRSIRHLARRDLKDGDL